MAAPDQLPKITDPLVMREPSIHGSSNNGGPAERAMRPIGIGRKNWLFAGNDAGGETLARAMTLIESAKLSGLDPQAYLADVLARINPRLYELLPWNWKPLPAGDNKIAA